MDGLTLAALMKKDKHVSPLFEGVFAADTLPRTLHKRPALIICNTDPIALPGQHWVACYVDKDGHGEYWDSYGGKPFVKQHRAFLNRVDLQSHKFASNRLRRVRAILRPLPGAQSTRFLTACLC